MTTIYAAKMEKQDLMEGGKIMHAPIALKYTASFMFIYFFFFLRLTTAPAPSPPLLLDVPVNKRGHNETMNNK